MEVKMLNQTQAALHMHSANVFNQPNSSVTGDVAKEQQKEFEKLSPQLQEELMKRVVEELNEKFKLFDNSLRIEIDKNTGIRVVKIVDNGTKEVIRQLPPEATLKIARYIDEITGLLFEQKA